jgi:hypothetical protein
MTLNPVLGTRGAQAMQKPCMIVHKCTHHIYQDLVHHTMLISNFKVKCRRLLFMCVELPNMCPPIAVVLIDSYSKVNKIHAAHFWVCMMATLGVFIDCKIRSNF